jgi:hypothetical protein
MSPGRDLSIICLEPAKCPPEEVAAWVLALLHTGNALLRPRMEDVKQGSLETMDLEAASTRLGFLSADHMSEYLAEAPKAVMTHALALLASWEGALHRLAGPTLACQLSWPAQFEAQQIQGIRRQFSIYVLYVDDLLHTSLYALLEAPQQQGS